MIMDIKKSGLRIIVTGTGGQGVITAARLLTEFFLIKGDQVVSGQLHGMAQRGGSVISTLMINCGISPAIPQGGAHIVVGFEPVETVRALPFMSDSTCVFMNMTPVPPFVLSQNFVMEQGVSQYPDVKDLEASILNTTPNVLSFDARDQIKKAGSPKVLNVFMLGCLFGQEILPYHADDFQHTMLKNIPSHLFQVNNNAFTLGVEFIKALNLEKTSNDPENRHRCGRHLYGFSGHQGG